MNQKPQSVYLQCLKLKTKIAELESQLEAVGAGGVESLRKKSCLHQIQEPAPVPAAPAAVAVPDERAAFEAKYKHLDLSHDRDAWMQEKYKHAAVSLAWEAWQARAALAATTADHFADAGKMVPFAQVVLPEQDVALLNQGIELLHALSCDERNRGNCSAAEGATASAYAVQRLAAALLAGVSAPAAQARSKSGWTFEELEAQLAEATKADPENCRAVGEELLKVIHENFTALKAAGWDGPADSPVEVVAALLNLLEEANSAAPQAQADARDAGEFWGVLSPCGEGVFFRVEADARWTHTGHGSGSDGFGVPTIGKAFRESYEDDELELVRVHIAAQAAQQGGAA